MRRTALTVVFLLGLMAPAAAQKVAIEAANAKWMEFFNKGDFDGVASLYTTDATAFPPGSGMVKGRAAIGAMWKNMAEQVGDPKVTTLRRQAIGAFRRAGNRHLQSADQGSKPQRGHRQISRSLGEGWKGLETRGGHLERRSIAAGCCGGSALFSKWNNRGEETHLFNPPRLDGKRGFGHFVLHRLFPCA